MTINTTPHGWPYLDQDNYVDETPDYTLALADKLENADADVAAAINAAQDAQEAADTAVAAAARMAVGVQNAPIPAGTSEDFVVNFPAGRFTVTPRLFLSSAGSRAVDMTAHVVTATINTGTFRVHNHSGTAGTVSLYWFAIQGT